MSVYPAPNHTIGVFNPDDYLTETNELDDNPTTSEDTTSHDQFLKKIGDSMIGTLTLPTLAFSNGTIQTTAFSNDIETQLANFSYDSETNTYTIDKLKVEEILFSNDLYGTTTSQVNNFLLSDKQQIKSRKHSKYSIRKTHH